MKRISKLNVIALVAFLLLGSLPVLGVDRPFALNGKGVATFITDGAGNLIGADPALTRTGFHVDRHPRSIDLPLGGSRRDSLPRGVRWKAHSVHQDATIAIMTFADSKRC